MSTFLLLTITGLGLGAMYFLVASGLSLIYGLMGVLNFAHGVFLTVTAYALWFTESKLGGVPIVPRFLIAAARRSGRRGGLRGADGARPDPSALRSSHRAGARHGRPGSRVTALVTAIWGSDAHVVAAPRLGRRDDDDLRCSHPERPLARDRHGGRSFSSRSRPSCAGRGTG